MKYLLGILIAVAVVTEANAKGVCDWPVPAFRIEAFEPSTISHASYDSAMAAVRAVYAPIFKAKRCPLDLIDGWSDGEINAQAWQEDGLCKVQVFGGLARYPGMTKNAIIEVTCHEIGHHLGGRPYYSGMSLSVEGQADHYATLDCMRRLGISSAAPSLALAKTLASLSGEPVPSRSTRARERVWRTIQDHPRAQCRLDEYDGAAGSGPRRCCWYAGVCG